MTASSTIAWNNVSTLDACVLVEESCASYYYALAGVFSELPKVSTLWTRMAMEEEGHAEEFRVAKAIHFSDYKRFDTENYFIESILERLDTLQKSLRIKTPSFADALMTSMILEKSVEKFHLDASKRILDPELSRLLNLMVEFSHAHIEMMRLAADSIDTSS